MPCETVQMERYNNIANGAKVAEKQLLSGKTGQVTTIAQAGGDQEAERPAYRQWNRDPM